MVTPHRRSKARACPCHPVRSEAVLPPRPHQAASVGRHMARLFFKTHCDMITLHLNKTISTGSRRGYCLPRTAASRYPAASTQKHPPTHTSWGHKITFPSPWLAPRQVLAKSSNPETISTPSRKSIGNLLELFPHRHRPRRPPDTPGSNRGAARPPLRACPSPAFRLAVCGTAARPMSNVFIGARGCGGSGGGRCLRGTAARLREPLREPRGGRSPPAGSSAGIPGAALRGECPVRLSPVAGAGGAAGALALPPGRAPVRAVRARPEAAGRRLLPFTEPRAEGSGGSLPPSPACSRPFVPASGKSSLASSVRGVPAPLCGERPYFGKNGFC